MLYCVGNNNLGVGGGDTGSEIFNTEIALVHNSSCQVVMIELLTHFCAFLTH